MVTAKSLITNYTEYASTVAGVGPHWVLYIVECSTPEMVYIGITNNPAKRIGKHARGTGANWTALYGVKSVRILAVLESKREAEVAEFFLWAKKFNKHPGKVGGCDHFIGPHPRFETR